MRRNLFVVVLVVIPAGEFAMGSPASEAGRGVDEGPQRQVSIAQAFALGRGEVTVAEFRRFIDEAGYKTEAERDSRTQGCSGFICFRLACLWIRI